MKKIYWLVNQFFKIGGTEIVTYQILSELKKNYEVHIILLSDDSINEEVFSDLNGLIVHKLNIDKQIIRNEDFFAKKNFFVSLQTVFKVGYFNFIKKFKYRKEILKLTNENDLIFYSSIFCYMIAPKNRKNYYHVHYNSRYINSFLNKIVFNVLSKKPKKYIFLCDETMNKVGLKPSTFIYNPSRIAIHDNFVENEKAKLIFIARFEHQKDPLSAVKVINELSKLTSNFECDFYGKGDLKEKMVSLAKELGILDKFIHMHDATSDVVKAFEGKDLMLMTSKFEGFALSIIEASSMCVPTCLYNYGDGCKEEIINGVTGLYIDKKDEKELAKEIYNIINDKKRLNEMKINAQKHARKFEIEKIGNDWVEFINGE